MHLVTKNKIVAALILLCLYSSIARAQDNFYIPHERTFYGGLVAGANFTQVDGDDYRGYAKIGANFGGIVFAQIDEGFALSMEILYSQKGSRSKGPVEAEPGLDITHYRIDLNYAEVPIMINYFFKRKSGCGAGFSYSQLASSGEELETDPAKAYNLEKYPFNKIDINFLLGGNIHIYGGIFLNLRFQYSMIPIRHNVPEIYFRGEQYNNLFAVRLMYLFK